MRIILLVALALTACSAETSPSFDPEAKAKEQEAKEQTAVGAGFQPPAPAPVATVALDAPQTDAPGSMLPPADRQYRYIGRWAATPALCDSDAWRFQSRKLVTSGETSCDFPTVAAVPNGYRLSGTCRSEGVDTEQTLQMAFDETKHSMSVRGKTLGPATLIYCGT